MATTSCFSYNFSQSSNPLRNTKKINIWWHEIYPKQPIPAPWHTYITSNILLIINIVIMKRWLAPFSCCCLILHSPCVYFTLIIIKTTTTTNERVHKVCKMFVMRVVDACAADFFLIFSWVILASISKIVIQYSGYSFQQQTYFIFKSTSVLYSLSAHDLI